MASLEEKLEALSRLNAADAAAIKALREALSGKNNLLIARAASVAARLEADELIDNLRAAFERLMVDPVKSDKTCCGKIDLANALLRLRFHERAEAGQLFLKGSRHVQKEPAFGGSVDTAVELRVTCLIGLAQSGAPEAPLELARLLVDGEVAARRGAIRAAGILGGETAEALLRMKALMGDTEPEVTADALTTLMELAPERSLEFVAGWLDNADEWLAESAAVAIGNSKSYTGFVRLRDAFENSIGHSAKKRLLLPIALARIDEAFEFLLEQIRDGYDELARNTAKVLPICATDEERRRRVREALEQRDDPEAFRAFEKAI